MKPSLATIAIILSVIAIVISLSQPLYSAYVSMNTSVSGKPSFNVDPFQFVVTKFDTQIYIVNNGTATAHDVKVRLNFYGPTSVSSTEFLPELQNGIHSGVGWEFPIGYFQLTYDGWNRSQYQAHVYIECEELSQTTEFTFNL